MNPLEEMNETELLNDLFNTLDNIIISADHSDLASVGIHATYCMRIRECLWKMMEDRNK